MTISSRIDDTAADGGSHTVLGEAYADGRIVDVAQEDVAQEDVAQEASL
ncbi:hypothetical protein ACT3R2_06070 [Halomonas sp. AOP43-D1-39]